MLQVLINDGDVVMIPQPYWVSYSDMVVYAGGKPIMLETTYENNFNISISQLKDCLSDKTKLLMINSPNNPSGNILIAKHYLILVKYFLIKIFMFLLMIFTSIFIGIMKNFTIY